MNSFAELERRATRIQTETRAVIVELLRRQSRIEDVGKSLATLDSQLQADHLLLEDAQAQCSEIQASLAEA